MHHFHFIVSFTGLIKLKDHVPVADQSRKSMSICLPRSKRQPLFAQECAVSFMWSKTVKRKDIGGGGGGTVLKLPPNKKKV